MSLVVRPPSPSLSLSLSFTLLPPRLDMTGTSTDSHKVLACITGASGFVGPAIALRFLSLGHSVRLPLRKQEQANAWLAEYGSKYEGKIETILLSKGMEEDGAFDEAVKGCEVVVHAASPANFHVPVRFLLLLLLHSSVADQSC